MIPSDITSTIYKFPSSLTKYSVAFDAFLFLNQYTIAPIGTVRQTFTPDGYVSKPGKQNV